MTLVNDNQRSYYSVARHKSELTILFSKVGSEKEQTGQLSKYVEGIESFTYRTDAQLDCSKNVKIYIKMYIISALTCFDFSQPSSWSYYMCFAKILSINS